MGVVIMMLVLAVTGGPIEPRLALKPPELWYSDAGNRAATVSYEFQLPDSGSCMVETTRPVTGDVVAINYTWRRHDAAAGTPAQIVLTAQRGDGTWTEDLFRGRVRVRDLNGDHVWRWPAGAVTLSSRCRLRVTGPVGWKGKIVMVVKMARTE